jgi:hypothetical protein
MLSLSSSILIPFVKKAYKTKTAIRIIKPLKKASGSGGGNDDIFTYSIINVLQNVLNKDRQDKAALSVQLQAEANHLLIAQ